MSIKNEYQQHNFLSNTGFGTVSPTEKVDVSGNVNVSTGNTYKINGTNVLTGSSLGSGITSSSLTSVGTLTSLTTSGITTLGNSLFLNARPIVRSGEGDTLTLLDFDFNQVTTADGIIRLFRNTNTTGSTRFDIFRGNNTADTNHSLAGEGNSYLGMYGNVGIGTVTPTQKTHIWGGNATGLKISSSGSTLGTSSLAFHANDGIGATDYHAGSITSESAVADADTRLDFKVGSSSSLIATMKGNGNVGIGTTNPQYPLDIHTTVSEPVRITTAGGCDILYANTNNGDTWQVGTTSTGSYFYIFDNAYRFVVERGGNVGIGTNNPGQRLHVYTTSNPGSNGAQIHIGDGTYGLFMGNGTGTGFSPIIQGIGNDTNDSGLQLSGALTNDTTDNIGILMDARTSADTAIANAKVLQLNNYSTNLITVNANGNVGIGSTTPMEPLDVVGNISTTGQIKFTNPILAPAAGWTTISPNDSRVLFYDYSGGNWSGMGVDFDGNWWLRTGQGSQYTMVFDIYGRLGIGTTNPLSSLHLSGTPSVNTPISLTLQPGENNDMAGLTQITAVHVGPLGKGTAMTFSTRNDSGTDFEPTNLVSEKMRINANGNVGIGTTNPLQKLDVVSSGFTQIAIRGQNASELFLEAGSGTQIYSNAGTSLAFGANGDNTHMLIDTAGNVGIGTTNPLFPLHVASTNNGTETIGSHGFLNNTGAGTSGSNLVGAQAKFTGTVHADLFRALSDARIKKDITLIDDNEALSKLRLIEPKKYRYIDTVTKGDQEVYGFIAQEVAAQFPEAVGRETSFLPNVYSAVTPDLDNEYITFPSGGAVDGILEIYTSKGRREITVSYVSTNTVRFQSGDIKEDDLVDGRIFVYGYRMDDVHALNKDYLFTINFAATQELDRRNQELTLKVTSLESELRSLKNVLNEKGIL